MSPPRWSLRCKPRGWIRAHSRIDLGFCPITVPVISRAIFAKWLDERKIKHLRGAPYHPMTQGKIERWHQTLKNRILLENYFLPGDLETQIAPFVDDSNPRRYHESIDNLTPADVYFGRGPTIVAERKRIKRQTIANRRLQHRLQAARHHQ